MTEVKEVEVRPRVRLLDKSLSIDGVGNAFIRRSGDEVMQDVEELIAYVRGCKSRGAIAKYYEYLVEDIIEDIEGDRILLLILDAKDKANEEHLTGILSRIDFTKHHPQFAGHVLDAIKQVTK